MNCISTPIGVRADTEAGHCQRLRREETKRRDWKEMRGKEERLRRENKYVVKTLKGEVDERWADWHKQRKPIKIDMFIIQL